MGRLISILLRANDLRSKGFCELLCREWPNLPESTQNLIHSELEERFDSDDRIRPYDEYAPLGMYCDRKAWEKVRALWTSSNEN